MARYYRLMEYDYQYTHPHGERQSVYGSTQATFGIIQKIALTSDGYFVKVTPYPFTSKDDSLLGGWHKRIDTETNSVVDEYGRWIRLTVKPNELSLNGAPAIGDFVRITYTGALPWNGVAEIQTRPGAEDTTEFETIEKGPDVIFSAITVL